MFRFAARAQELMRVWAALVLPFTAEQAHEHLAVGGLLAIYAAPPF
jgi:hypothetical protein